MDGLLSEEEEGSEVNKLAVEYHEAEEDDDTEMDESVYNRSMLFTQAASQSVHWQYITVEAECNNL